MLTKEQKQALKSDIIVCADILTRHDLTVEKVQSVCKVSHEHAEYILAEAKVVAAEKATDQPGARG